MRRPPPVRGHATHPRRASVLPADSISRRNLGSVSCAVELPKGEEHDAPGRASSTRSRPESPWELLPPARLTVMVHRQSESSEAAGRTPRQFHAAGMSRVGSTTRRTLVASPCLRRCVPTRTLRAGDTTDVGRRRVSPLVSRAALTPLGVDFIMELALAGVRAEPHPELVVTTGFSLHTHRRIACIDFARDAPQGFSGD